MAQTTIITKQNRYIGFRFADNDIIPPGGDKHREKGKQMKYTHGTIYQTIKEGKTEESYVLFNLVDDDVKVINELSEFLKTAKEEEMCLYEEDTTYEEDGSIHRTFNYKRKGI